VRLIRDVLAPHVRGFDVVEEERIPDYDASQVGGVTDWLRAAAMCAVAGVQMAGPSEESQIATHALAAVPHGTYVECFADPEPDPLWQAMWAHRPDQGRMSDVPSCPGFAFALDEVRALVSRYRSRFDSRGTREYH
jgi:L-alanine-DL-glutamate epimerase-like enolase superfamily enzyme